LDVLVNSLKLFEACKKLAELRSSNKSAFKLVTLVELATVKGEVPVATVDINVFAETTPVAVTPVKDGLLEDPSSNTVRIFEELVWPKNPLPPDDKLLTAYVLDPVV